MFFTRSRIIILIFFLIVINITGLFCDTYKPKYSIQIDYEELIKYFDSGYGWIETKSFDHINRQRLYSLSLYPVDEEKVDSFDRKVEKITEEIQRNFDSTLDICKDRIENIWCYETSFSTQQIKKALLDYIEYLRIKKESGTGQGTITIKIKFKELFKKRYGFDSSVEEREIEINGSKNIYKLGTKQIDEWIRDKDISGDTDGNGTITIYNGIKDWNLDVYEGLIIEKIKNIEKKCRYETYFTVILSESVKKFINDYNWKRVSTKKISIKSALLHEIIHNALKQFGGDDYWRDRNTGRWADEATVEDILLKIFPRDPINANDFSGYNTYEGDYNLAVWFYRATKLRDTSLFRYYQPANIQRKFNPPYQENLLPLEYRLDLRGESGVHIDIIKGFASTLDNSRCDDCRDEPLRCYAAPFIFCCNAVHHIVKNKEFRMEDKPANLLHNQVDYSNGTIESGPNSNFSHGLISSSSAGSDQCGPECPDAIVSTPGGDNADDNYSFSDGQVKIYNLAPESVIFTKGYWQDALKLYGGLKYDGVNAATQLYEATPFLIVPSGGLYGKEDDEVFKNILKNYISIGGIVVFFSQQYGQHWDRVLPVPDEEQLKTFGWREDQSCLRNSVYFNGIHPVVSSSTKQLCNVGVDGYIEAYPSSSTVILNRITNNKPALLYYPYGNGHVIITSMFTDWASAHGQMSNDELKIVRDLITFAKSPQTPIQMFNLAQNPTPDVALEVKVRNDTEHTAATVKIIAYTPDRKIKLYEANHSAAILTGGEAVIPITFTLPELTSKDYGICHVDFELYDAGNELIKMAEESVTGRFSIYKVTDSHTSGKNLDIWTTAETEAVSFDGLAKFTIHMKNNANEDLSVDLNYEWNHTGRKTIGTYTVGANSQIEVPFDSSPLATWQNSGIRMFWTHFQASGSTVSASGSFRKGIQLMRPMTASSITLAGDPTRKHGGSLGFTLGSALTGGPGNGETQMKVTLQKRSPRQSTYPRYTYSKVADVLSGTHDYSTGGIYNHTGSFTPDANLGAGHYRLRFEVTRPDLLKEVQYKSFITQTNNVTVQPFIPGQYLVAGQTYDFRATVKNNSPWSVDNGTCTFFLETENGELVTQKEVNNIVIQSNGQATVSESFVFAPPRHGKYKIRVSYIDESMLTPRAFQASQLIEFINLTKVSLDKKTYRYMDNAQTAVELRGLGTFQVQFTSPEAGVSDTRTVTLTLEANTQVVPFSVPIGFNINQTFTVNVTGDNAYTWNTAQTIPIEFVRLSAHFDTYKPQAVVGNPLKVDINIKELSGYPSPITTDLRLVSDGLNFDDTQTKILEPGIVNAVPFTINVPSQVTGTLIPMAYELIIGGQVIRTRTNYVEIPDAALKSAFSTKTLSAGDTLTVDLDNIGGKIGNFNLNFYIKDRNGKKIIDQSETISIHPGTKNSMSVTIPDETRSDLYFAYVYATETNTNKNYQLADALQISGLEVDLTSRTIKEKYFSNEIVSGLAELASGIGDINNGQLDAEIVQMIASGGLSQITPGEFLDYNSIFAGVGHNGKLYLLTVKGLLEFNPSSKQTTLLIDLSNIRYFRGNIYFDPAGNLWLGVYRRGLYLRQPDGTVTHFTAAGSGLLSDDVNDIIEYEGSSGSELWVATDSGISVYGNGQWSSYTSADGLPGDKAKKFAIEDSGHVWVSGQDAAWNDFLVKFNGTGFEAVTVPFDPSTVGSFMCTASDGSMWFMTDDTLYQFSAGSWNDWLVDELFPDAYISTLAADDDGIFLLGSHWENDRSNTLLIKYNGEFSTYSSTTAKEISGMNCVISFPGIETFLGAESSEAEGFGMARLNGSSWEKVLIEKDMDKLLANSTSMATDGQGNLWVGTAIGVSKYENGSWYHFYQSEMGESLGRITALAANSSNQVVAIKGESGGPPQLFRIEGNTVIEVPLPDFQDVMVNEWVLGLDNSGRAWMVFEIWGEVIQTVLYFNDSSWHPFNQLGFDAQDITQIVSDRSGGIWAGSDTEGICHINFDLSVQTYQANSSGLLINQIRNMFADKDGVLWIAYDTDGQSQPAQFPLQSFDGNAWSEYHELEGYPQTGAYAITQEPDSTIAVLGGIDWDQFNVYRLRGDIFAADTFTLELNWQPENKLFMSAANSTLFLLENLGEEGEDFSHKLYRLGQGLSIQQVWAGSYPIILNSGATQNQDLLTNQNLAAGSYVLKTKLKSSIEQVLAESDYPFVVRGVDVSIAAKCTAAEFPYIKSGSANDISFEVLNNTLDNKTSLNFIVKKVSPEGTEEELINQVVSLNAGESHQDTIEFSETESGQWKIYSEIREGTTLLSDSQLVVEVTKTQVSDEVIVPQFAGDDPIDLKVKLKNEGKIESTVQVSIPELSVDQEVILKPAEERVLTFNDTITADKVYNFTLSGDINKQQQITVQYGLKESLNLTVLPSYYEGNVVINYTLANSGGLPFKDDLHFELFAVGGAVPLYTVDKSHNLFPGQAAINDNISFAPAPGAYILKYNSSKTPVTEVPINVAPAGAGVITFTNPQKLPTGPNDLAFKIANSDSIEGNITLNVEVKETQTQAVVFAEQRHFFLQPGEQRDDLISVNIAARGNYILTIAGTKVATAISAPLSVLPMEEASGTVTIGAIDQTHIPVSINLTNTGYNHFTGYLQVTTGQLDHEEPVNAVSGGVFSEIIGIDTTALTAGTHEVKAFLYDHSGTLLSQATSSVTILPADIKLVEYTDGLEIGAGSFGEVSLKLKNEGHLRGEAIIKVTAFDTLNQTQEIALDPGEEITLDQIFVDVAGDVPSGNYPFNYSITGAGVTNGAINGLFNFKVNGVSLDVNATLDHTLYEVGDTARMTINVTSDNTSETPLEAVVNWGEYSERRSFTMGSVSEDLTFDIPVDAIRDDKVFYGVYHQGGKGIHLNDIYLKFKGALSVELDKQVYAPGDLIHATFTSSEAGELIAECLGISHTTQLASSGLIDFVVPTETLGGTFGISWSFTPANPESESVSGSSRFDVSGLVVKTAKSELDKGKYTPGENIRSTYTFESNMDINLELRNWVMKPTGDWDYLGTSDVALSSAQQMNAMSSYSFQTEEAGTHNLVYGLYRADQLVVSGSMAFTVGDAILIGVSTDKFEYPLGNEPVQVKINYFGEGAANCELYLDDEKVQEQSITLNGVGETIIPLTAAQVKGGSHSIKVLLKKDGLISEKQTSFIYGTNLPDLSLSVSDVEKDGLNYVHKVTVVNSGKTASAATSLTFSDNGTDVGSASVPGLQPNQSSEHTFTWSGTGKSGSHEFIFAVDPTDTIKEFSETNNEITFTEDIPVVFYKLEVEPQVWPANSQVSIMTRIINNKDALSAFTLNLTITNNSSSEAIFQREKVVEVGAFGNQLVTDMFSTAIYPAGEYTVSQTLSSVDADLSEEVFVIIEATKAVTGTLELIPAAISSGVDSDVELKMKLKNNGNIALEEEILTIEVINKETTDVAKTDQHIFSLQLIEEKDETKTLSLNLTDGTYEVKLSHLEREVAKAELVVSGGLEKDKQVPIKPRVLIQIHKLFNSIGDQVLFLQQLFSSFTLQNELAPNILESGLKIHKLEHNIHVIFGNLLVPGIREELKQRVFSGEGLILIVDKPLNNPHVKELTGVRVKNVAKKKGETSVVVKLCELSSGGEFNLLQNNTLELSPEAANVEVIAESKTKKYPLISYRRYGRGYVLVMAVPLQFAEGMETIAQLLVTAVQRFGQDVYTTSDISRLLPVEFKLTNQTGAEKEYIIKEILPYGATAFDHYPIPEEGEELKWKITVAAGETGTVSYWLRMPDQIGSYEVKTEIYEAETKIDEISLTFDVSQMVLSRVDELITLLDNLEVSGKDANAVKKAQNHLQSVRNRAGDTLVAQLLNLADTLKAAGYLGDVENTDVTQLRLQVVNLIKFYSRNIYEALIQLSPLLRNLQLKTMVEVE